MKAKILLLLLGLAIGLAAAVLFPRLRDGLTPGVLRQAPTEGIVEEKRREADRLLLTLVTPDGAVLATFTQRVSEIDLLVAPGDTVSLGLDGYRPFVEDPEIERVVKAPPAAAAVPPLPDDVPVDPQPQEPVDDPMEPLTEESLGAGAERPAAGTAGPPTNDPAEPQPEPAS